MRANLTSQHLCELVDGTLEEKALGYMQSVVAVAISMDRQVPAVPRFDCRSKRRAKNRANVLKNLSHAPMLKCRAGKSDSSVHSASPR